MKRLQKAAKAKQKKRCLSPLFFGLDSAWRFASLLAIAILLAGCSLGYYYQAATGHLDIISKREPIRELLVNKEQLTENERQKLAFTQQVRQFALRVLALPVGETYSHYVDLERRYVVWNVFAAEEFSVAAKTWCYPIIGCASYRGYYKRSAADRYAAKLEDRNYEVHIGGVPAYSTLGWFNDPVLNTFLHRDEISLLALLVHEISHRVAYAKSDTAFNESFATAMEMFGVDVWLAMQSDSADWENQRRQYRDRKRASRKFVDLVLQARRELEVIYSGQKLEAEMRTMKQRIFTQLENDLQNLDRRFGLENSYSRWARELTNAKIAPINTYHQWVDAIRNRLDESLAAANCSVLDMQRETCRIALTLFYGSIEVLAKQRYDDRQQVLQRWSQDL